MKNIMNRFLNAYFWIIIILLHVYKPSVAQQSSGEIVIGKVFSKSEGPLIGVTIKEVDATNRVISGTITGAHNNLGTV